MVRKGVFCEQSGRIMEKTMVTRQRTHRAGARKKSGKGFLSGVLVCAIAVSLSGCGLFDEPVSQAPPPTRVKKNKKNKKAADAAVVQENTLQPLVDMEEYQRPEYPGRRRNPFQPDLDVFQPVQTAVVGEVRPLEPLEEFALSQLSLVALISETSIPMAMFVDSSGLGHVVKEGDRIGRNGGVIASIRDNEVEIREGSEDAEQFGGSVITLRLRDLELSTGEDEGLSAQDRETLERLLQSEHGRQVIEQLRSGEQPQGESPVSAGEPARTQVDSRFQGIAPPR